MADLLLELLSEEIPARMQQQAAKDLERLMVGALSERNLLCEAIKAFAGPRRLTLAISGLPAKQSDLREEKKGPRTNANEKAIEGFLRAAGVSLDQCQKQNDAKGEFYVAVIDRKGRQTAEVLAEFLPELLAKMPWPKSMRWRPFDPVRWVRPLHSIVAVFDGDVVAFEFAGVRSSNITLGHRFLSRGTITVRRFDDYRAELKEHFVILDAQERADTIHHELCQKAFALGLEPIEDRGLLEEVSGLCEYPVVLIGTIPAQFMDIPREILKTSMRTHQKYFALRDSRTGAMANRFGVVANMITTDNGRQIIAGNERVLRARLSDAKFFWQEDLKKTLEARLQTLKGVVFHARLGSQFERAERIEELSAEIARKIGADVSKSRRAARLAKADLTSGVVGEFPELQGIMGRYYALHDREDPEVAEAICDHYKPIGPHDDVPSAPVSRAVGLADKLDTLGCFFAIDEKPTGSGDPYALRRAALGAIRLILAAQKRLPLMALIRSCSAFAYARGYLAQNPEGKITHAFVHGSGMSQLYAQRLGDHLVDVAQDQDSLDEKALADLAVKRQGLISFFADRLKIALKEKGTRHDLIDAVFSVGHEDDLVRLVAKVESLQHFLKSEDGANLLTGYRRAANILKVEEKRDGKVFISEVHEQLLKEPAEKALYLALQSAKGAIAKQLAKEDFSQAMQQMAALRVPVDVFFEGVKVNAEDRRTRENRLNLLASLRATLHQVADFSKIEG